MYNLKMKKFMLVSNAITFLIILVINFIYYFGGFPDLPKIGNITGVFYQIMKIIVFILDLWMVKKFCKVVNFFI